MLQSIFQVECAEESSNRRNAESLILSHWNDFLQDAEEDPTQISLSEILFLHLGAKFFHVKDWFVKSIFCTKLKRTEIFPSFRKPIRACVFLNFLLCILISTASKTP
jgi:hypothetical protein